MGRRGAVTRFVLWPDDEDDVSDPHSESDGRSAEDIAGILWVDHRLETSESAVLRLLERYRSERAEVAKVLVRDAIRGSIIPAVRRICAIAAMAARMERQARDRAAELRKVHPQHRLQSPRTSLRSKRR